jgi:sialic acid synthase SpsE
LDRQRVKELATFTLTCQTTPVSNAVVERIFSLVSFIKMKARKRMQLNLLDAIVRVRAELLLSNKCCKDFIASPEMLQNFTSDKVCAICSTHSSGEDSNDIDLDLFM